MENEGLQETRDVKKRPSRRSSILKMRKNRAPSEELDFTETFSDVTLSKTARRVSFASSNFVKPFTSDPDKNTIWDTTYEEDVNHTNSTQSSQEQLVLTCTKVQSVFSDTTVTNHTLHVGNVTNLVAGDMDLTRNVVGIDKENIPQTATGPVSIVDMAKKMSTKSGILGANASRYGNSMMEFTCQDLISTKCDLNVSTWDDVQKTKPQNEPRDLSMCSMEFTCQIPKLDNDTSLKVRQNDALERTSCEENIHQKQADLTITSDMEFTCQMPKIHQQVNDLTLSSSMQLSCQLSANEMSKIRRTLGKLESRPESSLFGMDTEKLLQMSDNSPCRRNVDLTLSENMELNCQLPTKRDMYPSPRTAVLESEEKINLDVGSKVMQPLTPTDTSDMEFTGQFPSIELPHNGIGTNNQPTVKNMLTTQNVSRMSMSSNMELTCQLPQLTTFNPQAEVTCPDDSLNISAQIQRVALKDKSVCNTMKPKIEVSMVNNQTLDCQTSQLLRTTEEANIEELSKNKKTRRVFTDKPQEASDLRLPDIQFAHETKDSLMNQNHKMEFTHQSSVVQNPICQKQNLTLTETRSIECEVLIKSEPIAELKSQPLIPTNDREVSLKVFEKDDIKMSFVLRDGTKHINDADISKCEQINITRNKAENQWSVNIKNDEDEHHEMDLIETSTISMEIDESFHPCTETSQDVFMEGGCMSLNLSSEFDVQKTEKLDPRNVGIIPETLLEAPVNTENDKTYLPKHHGLRQNRTVELEVSDVCRTDERVIKEDLHKMANKFMKTSQIPIRTKSSVVHTPEKLSAKKQKLTKDSQSQNILFSQKPSFLTSLCNDESILKTPEPSFHLNVTNISSGVDDTQHLINCTYPNSTLGDLTKSMCLNEKSECQVSRPNLTNISDLEKTSNDPSPVPVARKLANINDTYSLKGKEIRKAQLNETDDSIIEAITNDDDSDRSLGLIANECLDDGLPNAKQENLDSRTILYESIHEDSIELSRPFVMKEYKPPTSRISEVAGLLKNIEEQEKHIVDYLKNFKFKDIPIPKELLITENISSHTLPSMDQKSEDEVNNPPQSLEEKIRKHQESCQGCWKLESVDADSFYFSTLVGNLVLVVDLDPETGKVSRLETINKLPAKCRPIGKFAMKYVMDKFSESHLESAIGRPCDIFSLLDYIQMTVLRIHRFRKDFMSCFDFIMMENFILKCKLISVPLGLAVEVFVNVADIDNLNIDEDISIVQEIGHVNEEQIKNFAKNCPKGLDFFRCFSQKLQDYLSAKERNVCK